MQGMKLTEGLHGRFAVVKLWPTIQVAEDEVIARLKSAAAGLGLECIEILADGRALAAPHAPVTHQEVDFAIHLHFDTPKAYDLFSFVALWNPTRLMQNHVCGEFVRYSRNLASHDDFLSCGSLAADDHVRRMLLSDPMRDGPRFTMFHSLAGPILAPTFGARKIAYVGINWERVRGVKGRHQDLLKLLEKAGVLRIYGPRRLHGVNVWRGFRSYVAPLPFDGVSVVQALHDAGIGLVLASEMHKEDGIMSCRLFETVAAGAIAICDEHPFAREHFGDTLLYVDTTGSSQETFRQVMEHLRWIEKNPTEAIALARRAQEIFKSRFALDLSLRTIYEGFAARKRDLDQQLAPRSEQRINLFLLLPEFDRAALHRHIESAEAQVQEGVAFVLLVNEVDYAQHAEEIEASLRAARKTIACQPTKFTLVGQESRFLKLGRIIDSAVNLVPEGQLFGFVGPQERLMANHLRSLAGCLARQPDADCSYCDVTLKSPVPAPDGSPVVVLQWEVDLFGADPNRPLGFSRFLFRKSESLLQSRLALPHLHHKPMAALISRAKCVASRRTTVLSLLAPEGTHHPTTADIAFEDAILEPLLPCAEEIRQLAGRPIIAPPPGNNWPTQPDPRNLLHRALRARPLIRPIEQALRKLRRKKGFQNALRSIRVPSLARTAYKKVSPSIQGAISVSSKADGSAVKEADS